MIIISLGLTDASSARKRGRAGTEIACASMDHNQERLLSFGKTVEFEDMQQGTLFVVREALFHAKKRGLTVGIFKDNVNILAQILDSTRKTIFNVIIKSSTTN